MAWSRAPLNAVSFRARHLQPTSTPKLWASVANLLFFCNILIQTYKYTIYCIVKPFQPCPWSIWSSNSTKVISSCHRLWKDPAFDTTLASQKCVNRYGLEWSFERSETKTILDHISDIPEENFDKLIPSNGTLVPKTKHKGMSVSKELWKTGVQSQIKIDKKRHRNRTAGTCKHATKAHIVEIALRHHRVFPYQVNEVLLTKSNAVNSQLWSSLYMLDSKRRKRNIRYGDDMKKYKRTEL